MMTQAKAVVVCYAEIHLGMESWAELGLHAGSARAYAEMGHAVG